MAIPPPEHASQWTPLVLAERIGIVVSAMFGILKRRCPRPRRVKVFKFSRVAKFQEKIRDVVGLYVDPPALAVVISVDDKMQILALGRTQMHLPMKPDYPEVRMHEYKRNGTAFLIATLDIATGKVMGQMSEHYRSEEKCRYCAANGLCLHRQLAVSWLIWKPNWTMLLAMS